MIQGSLDRGNHRPKWGNALVDGTDFTITNNGDGTPDVLVVSNGGQLTVSGVPDGGTVDLTVTDAVGCSINISIGPIDASAYCPSCGADAGSIVDHTNRLRSNAIK